MTPAWPVDSSGSGIGAISSSSGDCRWRRGSFRTRPEEAAGPRGAAVSRHLQATSAVARWPELAARLRACERIVAESPGRAERRAAAAEISQILWQAETISA